MIKLLRADIARLFKDKVFYTALIFNTGLAVFIVMTRYFDSLEYQHYINIPDDFLFVGTEYIGIIISILTAAFIGTDYSSGVIRNKLTSGHRRISIYFSELFTGIIAAVIIYFAFIAAVCLLSALGFTADFRNDITDIVKTIFIVIPSIAAFTAFFTAIDLPIASRTASLIVGVCLALGMIISVSALKFHLSADEYRQLPVEVTEYGQEPKTEPQYEKNPAYVDGAKRKAYQAIYDILPNGQLVDINEAVIYYELDKFSGKKQMLFAFSEIIVFTALGIFVFLKRDIK